MFLLTKTLSETFDEVNAYGAINISEVRYLEFQRQTVAFCKKFLPYNSLTGINLSAPCIKVMLDDNFLCLLFDRFLTKILCGCGLVRL